MHDLYRFAGEIPNFTQAELGAQSSSKYNFKIWTMRINPVEFKIIILVTNNRS